MSGSTEEGELDALVRRVDPDRWLSSCFIADRGKRADVIAIYAYDHELARAKMVASNPLIAEIRLTWWREVLDEIFGGKLVRTHPTASALTRAVRGRGLRRGWLETPIDARIEALGGSETEARDAARRAAGAVAVAAAAVLGDPELAENARPAGELWAGALATADFSNELSAAKVAARRLQAEAFPAVAHATLARVYAAGRRPSAVGARLRVLASVLTGAI